MPSTYHMLMRSMVLILFALPYDATICQDKSNGTSEHSASPHNCNTLHHADHPMARISNGKLNAIIFLPDATHGFYRGSRFDWAGVIGCVSLNGHTFFGEWFDHYDPLLNDAVTGPVEEFRHPTSELGYDEAASGGVFLKIGVGLLKRIDNSPYTFGGAYPILDHGKWSVDTHSNSITFKQQLHTPIGFAYLYTKTLTLDAAGKTLTLVHELKNIGIRTIDTAVYDHDFLMLDKRETGPGMELRLPFAPVATSPLPDTMKIDGNTIRFTSALQLHTSAGGYLKGYSNKVSDYDVFFEDKKARIGVEQTADSPISNFYLWATPKTVCPEAYIAIHVVPGTSQSWTIHYLFFAN